MAFLAAMGGASGVAGGVGGSVLASEATRKGTVSTPMTSFTPNSLTSYAPPIAGPATSNPAQANLFKGFSVEPNGLGGQLTQDSGWKKFGQGALGGKGEGWQGLLGNLAGMFLANELNKRGQTASPMSFTPTSLYR